MHRSLTYDLHLLTARMDRAADRMLTAHCGLSYRRFLTLLTLGGLGAASQRTLADRLGVTEPSLSRMAATLAQAGLLDLRPHPAGGNRRQLTLTPSGRETVQRCQQLLDRRFDEVVQRSGVPRDQYAEHTTKLLEALDDPAGAAL